MWPFSKKQNLDRRDSDETHNDSEIKATTGIGPKALIFACGAALFSDGYANAGIGPVNTILKLLYSEAIDGTNYSQLLSSMAFAGTIVGMLLFGALSDFTGRRGGMLAATLIIFVFSALSAAAKGAGGSTPGMLKALIAYRFLLGVGIGAEYPSGSVACAENTEGKGVAKNRQQMFFQLATNSMIDFGFVVATFIPWLLLQICGENHLRLVWRLSLGLGVIPPLLLLYFRVKMKEPDAYLKHGIKRRDIPYWLIFKRYWVKLAAISACWFLYDWIVYPFGLYSSTITAVADKNSTLSSSLGWGCLANAFYLPGTLIGALFVVDRLGPKYTMILGLVLQSITGFALSGAYEPLTKNNTIAGFAILYGVFLSFGELGPGNNLGLLATKSIGPTCVRGQFYGLAAAIGKVGAFVGTYTFPQIIKNFGGEGTYTGDTGVFYLGSGLALVSAAIVYFFIPNISADYMEQENQAFREYLEENGYDMSLIGFLMEDPEAMGTQKTVLHDKNGSPTTVATAPLYESK